MESHGVHVRVPISGKERFVRSATVSSIKMERVDVTPKTPDMEPIEMSYEGFWSRLFCGNCEETFYVEIDVQNGELVTCDGCGKEGEVSRTT